MAPLLKALSVIATLGLIYLWYFFFEWSGMDRLRTRRYVRRLRDNLDPVASKLPVRLTVQNDEKGTLMCYTFEDGNYVSMMIWVDGFNTFTPQWLPGFEKQTEGLDSLVQAIEGERQKAILESKLRE